MVPIELIAPSLNSAFTWGSDDFSFSLQLTYYPRKTFMFTWRDGKFHPPENIAELIEIVTQLYTSHGNSSQQVEKVITQTTSILTSMQSDEAMRQQAEISMAESGQTLQEAIPKKRETNQPPLPDLLTQATQANSRLTVSVEISAEQQQEENIDEVIPYGIRPRTKSQLRKRTTSVLDVSDVKENTLASTEEDYRQRSSSLIARESQLATRTTKSRDNKTPAEDDTFRPRSRTLEIRKHRTSSEHSD
ncbi:hypothetical protein [Erwinia sp. V71]|uniref:hypothetical protein n=1 Tax=Erwinia sp. V71 TaxID=3369424 RepID=UPI003F60A012